MSKSFLDRMLKELKQYLRARPRGATYRHLIRYFGGQSGLTKDALEILLGQGKVFAREGIFYWKKGKLSLLKNWLKSKARALKF